MCLLWKILEKIVKVQLQQLIDQVSPLSLSQHGFCTGRSTLTNLLGCDAIIADLGNVGSPHDILTFDFHRAFDKVPRSLLIAVLAKLTLHVSSLKWIDGFFKRSLTVYSQYTQSILWCTVVTPDIFGMQSVI